MSYLHNTISAKAIIGRVMMNFGVQDANLHLDAMEWIGDTIAEIGYHAGLVDKVARVTVSNHSFLLPADLVRLDYIVYGGRKLKYGIPKNYRGGGGHPQGGDDPLFTELVRLVQAREESICHAEGIVDDAADTCCGPILEKSELDRVNTKIKSLMEAFGKRPSNTCDEYFIKQDGCYKTSIQKGDLYVYYKAYPLTDDGYPLVVDEVKYKRALEYSIMYYLLLRGYKHPTLTFDAVLKLKELYIARARNEHYKMTTQEMHKFIDSWANLLFSIGKSSNMYSNG